MNRHIARWALLFVALAVVGLWPATATPVTLAASGAAVILATIPGPVLLAVAVIVWLRHKPTPAKTARA
jgi:hypothetical protein